MLLAMLSHRSRGTKFMWPHTRWKSRYLYDAKNILVLPNIDKFYCQVFIKLQSSCPVLDVSFQGRHIGSVSLISLCKRGMILFCGENEIKFQSLSGNVLGHTQKVLIHHIYEKILSRGSLLPVLQACIWFTCHQEIVKVAVQVWMRQGDKVLILIYVLSTW